MAPRVDTPKTRRKRRIVAEFLERLIRASYIFANMLYRTLKQKNWIAILSKAGSVIDIGATSMPRHVFVHSHARTLTPEEQIEADWSVVADDFNRAARGEGRSQNR